MQEREDIGQGAGADGLAAWNVAELKVADVGAHRPSVGIWDQSRVPEPVVGGKLDLIGVSPAHQYRPVDRREARVLKDRADRRG